MVGQSEETIMAQSEAHKLGETFGFLYAQEIDLLRAIAGDLPANGVFVNIGVGVGTSSLTVAETRADVKIYSVDIDPGGPNEYVGLHNEIMAFHNAGLNRVPTQIIGCSWEVGHAWDRGPADLIMIDAGHLTNEIENDIAAWRSHVKKGGIILFHDYKSVHWPGVKEAVDRNFGENNGFLVKTLKAFRM